MDRTQVIGNAGQYNSAHQHPGNRILYSMATRARNTYTVDPLLVTISTQMTSIIDHVQNESYTHISEHHISIVSDVKAMLFTQQYNNNNNNCLKSNIQCIEIRVQWTVHLGSSHMHVSRSDTEACDMCYVFNVNLTDSFDDRRSQCRLIEWSCCPHRH